jgi:prepilin-type processing-associated H-X9-DG protein
VREAAARMQCSNNLKQLGLAAHAYHDTYNGFPPYYNVVPGSPTRSWATAILPYIEQQNSQAAQSYNSGTPIKTFVCPSNGGTGVTGNFALTHYVAIPGDRFSDYLTGGDTGVLSVYIGNGTQKVAMTSITDGTSNTVIIGERPALVSDWYGYLSYKDYDSMVWAFYGGTADAASPTQATNVSSAPGIPYVKSTGIRFASGSSCPPQGFGPGHVRETCDASHLWSQHTGGANFTLGDGSVRYISYTVGATLVRQLATRAGGEVVSGF